MIPCNRVLGTQFEPCHTTLHMSPVRELYVFLHADRFCRLLTSHFARERKEVPIPPPLSFFTSSRSL